MPLKKKKKHEIKITKIAYLTINNYIISFNYLQEEVIKHTLKVV